MYRLTICTDRYPVWFMIDLSDAPAIAPPTAASVTIGNAFEAEHNSIYRRSLFHPPPALVFVQPMFEVTSVPEPKTSLLILISLAALILYRVMGMLLVRHRIREGLLGTIDATRMDFYRHFLICFQTCTKFVESPEPAEQFHISNRQR
jgi:hypothetical protein